MKGYRNRRAHLCLVQWQVFPCQQIALHQVHAVIDRGTNEDREGNGFHSSHFPARPVHDGHHQADHPCVKKVTLGKLKGLGDCCPGLLTHVNRWGVWGHTPAAVHASQSEPRTHSLLPTGANTCLIFHWPQGPFNQVIRPAGDSEAPN